MGRREGRGDEREERDESVTRRDPVESIVTRSLVHQVARRGLAGADREHLWVEEEVGAGVDMMIVMAHHHRREGDHQSPLVERRREGDPLAGHQRLVPVVSSIDV